MGYMQAFTDLKILCTFKPIGISYRIILHTEKNQRQQVYRSNTMKFYSFFKSVVDIGIIHLYNKKQNEIMYNI